MDALLEVCSFYEDLALSCLGPYGRLKALQAAPHTPASVLTSISGPLLQGVRPAHQLGQLLAAGTAQAQHAQYGDGGLACLYLAARMVRAVLGASPSRHEIYESCSVLQALGDRMYAFLSSGICKSAGSADATALCVPCESLQHYLALCRGVLFPKLACLLDAAEIERTAAVTVEAFISTLPDEHAGLQSAAASHSVTFQTFRGEDARDSCVLPGILLPAADMTPESLGVLLEMAARQSSANSAAACDCADGQALDGGILLIREGLDVRGNQHDAQNTSAPGCRTIQADQLPGEAPGDPEVQELVRIMTALDRLLERSGGPHIVACQKGVHPVVHDFLVSKGVASFQRLGASRIALLAKITACAPIESLFECPGVLPCGHARVRAEVKVLYGHEVVHLQPSETAVSSVPVTVMLSCPMDAVAEHVRLAAESSLRLLRATIEQGAAATAGVGAIELALVKDIEAWSIVLPTRSARQAAVIDSVTGALSQLGKRVANNGIDRHAYILDSLPCKMACLQRAVSTALQLLKLDKTS
ncbi:hypothetical protein PLESTM_001589500 [Pleodorina starrii]|nr:hypothetical protein PLESTM_001589500 [Pleodorina starrii]